MRIGCFLFLTFLSTSLFAAETRPTQALFKSVQGDVQVRLPHHKSLKPAQEDMVLSEGDRVITRADSSAVLRMFDGSEISISPRTEFLLKKLQRTDTNDKILQFKLLLGKIAATVKALTTAKSSFEIEAGGLVCGVRGTIFSTEFEDKLLIVNVTQGTVYIAPFSLSNLGSNPKNGELAVLKAGQKIMVNTLTGRVIPWSSKINPTTKSKTTTLTAKQKEQLLTQLQKLLPKGSSDSKMLAELSQALGLSAGKTGSASAASWNLEENVKGETQTGSVAAGSGKAAPLTPEEKEQLLIELAKSLPRDSADSKIISELAKAMEVPLTKTLLADLEKGNTKTNPKPTKGSPNTVGWNLTTTSELSTLNTNNLKTGILSDPGLQVLVGNIPGIIHSNNNSTGFNTTTFNNTINTVQQTTSIVLHVGPAEGVP